MSDTIDITGIAQHSSWLSRVLPPIEQLRPDLWSIPVPIPDSPLRYVSVYVLCDSNGLMLIDAGWDSDESWSVLCEGLTHIGASIRDVRGCLVTHQHFDHLGLARRVREASDAWIGLHPADRDALADPEFSVPSIAMSARVTELISWGASLEEAAALRGERSRFVRRSLMARQDRLIEDNQLIRTRGWSLRALHTPGHTPGHLCFIDEEKRLLFSGDHILPRISPNISAYRASSDDALRDFLSSLDRCVSEDIDEILPAHEWRFRGLRTRAQELKLHHERRLSQLLDAIRHAPGSTPWDLAALLPWSRPWHEYDGPMRISAVSETLAHVRHLLRLGLVSTTGDATPRYTVVDAAQEPTRDKGRAGGPVSDRINSRNS